MVGAGGPGGVRAPWAKEEGGRRKEETKTARARNVLAFISVFPFFRVWVSS